MTHVLNARSVLAILARRPQPEITRLRQLKPEFKEPFYPTGTFVGMFHRRFPLEYKKQFGQPVPDWIWFEHPQTIIDLSNLAMKKNRLLPNRSPEPPSLLIQIQREINVAIQAACKRMMEGSASRYCHEYRYLASLCEIQRILGHHTLERAMRWESRQLTEEAFEAMADEFGF